METQFLEMQCCYFILLKKYYTFFLRKTTFYTFFILFSEVNTFLYFFLPKMAHLVIEDSSDFTFRDLMSLRGLIVEKRPTY